MAKLDDLLPNAAVRGILPDSLVTVVSVQWFGSEAIELTYKTATGKVADELLYRHDEPRIEIVELGRPWSFDGDGARFRLVSEAQRIRLAHLFDPVLAVPYKLSDPEAHLYKAVTNYVREEFNRANALENNKYAGTVGFALTILQRRLASLPEAIYQSLRRRRERLESRLRELEVLHRGARFGADLLPTMSTLDADDVEDLEDAPDNEVEAAEDEILDHAHPVPPGPGRSSWRSNGISASSRRTARRKSSATTSRAASPAPASCGSSRSRAARRAPPRLRSPATRYSTRSTSRMISFLPSSSFWTVTRTASTICGSHSSGSRISG